MPTPSPISAASVGEMFASEITCEVRPIVSRPLPTATTAPISGSAIAPSEPKAKKRMIAAAMMPTSSLVEAGFWPTPEIALPPSSTCRPPVRADSPILITLRMSASLMSPPCPMKLTVA